eukprot:Clim_evm91s172 gene=Clim_evmTU91s172
MPAKVTGKKPATRSAAATGGVFNFLIAVSVVALAIGIVFTYNKEEHLLVDLLNNVQKTAEETLFGTDDNSKQLVKDLLVAYSDIITKHAPEVAGDCTVAVGYVGNLDIIVDAADFIDAIDQEITEPKHHEHMTTLDHVTEVFLFFFQRGAAAERYLGDYGLFEVLVAKSKELPGFKTALGGNGAVMANRMASKGCEVILGATVGPHMEGHIHKNIKVSGQAGDDEDIHIILEYPHDQVFRTHTSPRANRFIITHDRHNGHLAASDTFHKEVREHLNSGKDLHGYVIGGLQLMEGQDETMLRSKLLDLQKFVLELPKTTKIHLELGSFADPDVYAMILDYLLPFSDSIGLNEQEIFTLYKMLATGELHNEGTALLPLQNAVDMLYAVFDDERMKELDRIHLHTLAYHVMCQRPGHWQNPVPGLVDGALRSTRHACDKEQLNDDLVELRMLATDRISSEAVDGNYTVSAQHPTYSWFSEKHKLECHLALMLVCKDPVRTVGLGDNISSSALAHNFGSLDL